MGNPADREGNFRCEIVDYGMKEYESGAVAVRIKVKLTEMFDFESQSWVPWEYDQEAYGNQFVVKKDGSLNDTTCKSLMQNAGWDGDFDSIHNHTWVTSRCQVQLKENTYDGKTEYQVAFVNSFDRTPGAMGAVDEARVKEMKTRFGAPLRVLAGTIKAQSAKPNGKPPAPKTKQPEPVGALPPNGQASGGGPDDEIPFAAER